MSIDARTHVSTNRQEWLESRKSSVGSSEVAALFGVSPWTTRDKLWAIKSGIVEADDLSKNEVVYWGKMHETAILNHAKHFQKGIELWPQSAIVKHKEHDCIHSTPDAVVWDDNGEPIAVVEAKFIPFNRKEWKDEVPLHYSVQCQHHMEVLDVDKCAVSVLFNGYDYQEFWLERDRTFGAMLVEKCLEFIQFVRDGERPPVDDVHQSEIAVTSHIYRERSGSTVALDPSMMQVDQQWLDCAATLRIAEANLNACKDKIRRAMKHATYARLPNGVSYKITSNNQLRRKD